MPASERTQVKRKYVVKDNDRQRILLKSSTVFIEISMSFIKASEQSGKLSSQKAKAYIKEILHSIFFFVYISSPSICPSEILGESMASRLEKIYPDVFEGYRTKLPLRPPYSIVLDAVVETKGDERVHEILQELLKLNEAMTVPNDDGKECGNVFCFASTVVSFCYFEDVQTKEKTRNYFGGSIACRRRRNLRNIFLDLSCIETWNRKVALGVCLAHAGEKSILLPKTVRSAAFHMLNDKKDEDRNGETQVITIERSGPAETGNNSGQTPAQRYTPWSPCKRCVDIFPDVEFSPSGMVAARWKHGNCAECEAISKLLNGEAVVDERVKNSECPNEDLTDDSVRARLKPLLQEKIKRLRHSLKSARFSLNEGFVFYRP